MPEYDFVVFRTTAEAKDAVLSGLTLYGAITTTHDAHGRGGGLEIQEAIIRQKQRGNRLYMDTKLCILTSLDPETEGHNLRMKFGEFAPKVFSRSAEGYIRERRAYDAKALIEPWLRENNLFLPFTPVPLPRRQGDGFPFGYD